jgi:cell division septation protein DedD
MRSTRIALAAIMLSVLVTGIAQAGGQASVTILKAPKDVVAGQTFEVAFTVTPNWPMAENRSLEPMVKAVCGDRVVTLAAVQLKSAGHYKAAVALPSEGEWVITVDSRFCHTKMKPLVLKAEAAKATQT